MDRSEQRDTACPYTLNFNGNRTERWPDAIGIGFSKCGTGTLHFLDCHSNIVIRENEPAFWSMNSFYSKGLHGYALPYASKNEILIEKTPHYTFGSERKLKETISRIKKSKIKNPKIIIFLCDPTKRYLSSVKQQLINIRLVQCHYCIQSTV